MLGHHARRRQRAGGGGSAALRRTLLAVAALALPALAAAAAPLLHAGHPLAGRAWDVAQRRFIAIEDVKRRVAAADFALLGETHDNPAHHDHQAMLLRHAIARGRRPALVLEPLDRERQADVDRAAAEGKSAADLGAAAQVSRGWDWPLYTPLVEIALRHRLPIVAGNLSRADARFAASRGLEGVVPGSAARLAVEDVWDPQRAKVLREELVAGHCGEDGPRIEAMARMQRARDAVLADRILAHVPAIAIVGRGHARADIGVPLYLRRRAPGNPLVSLAFVEVREGRDDPAGYEEAAPGRHDIVWFTARAARPDPCAGFEPEPKVGVPK